MRGGIGDLYSEAAWKTGTPAQARPKLKRALAAMAKLSASIDAPFLVGLIPDLRVVNAALGAPPPNSKPDEDYERPRREAIQILDELQIRYVDAQPLLLPMGTEKAYFKFDGHLRPLAHRLFAGALRKALDEQLAASAARMDTSPVAGSPDPAR